MSFLSEHGATLLLGSTAVLLVACIAIACSRVPVHHKRIGELAVWGVLAFLVLTVVPLPRLLVLEAPRPIAGDPVSASGADLAPAPIPARQLPAPPVDVLVVPEVARTTVPDRATIVAVPQIGALPAGSPSAEVPSGSSWLASLVSIYLVGVALCLIWLLAGLLYLGLLLARSRPAPQWVRDLMPEKSVPRVVVTPYRCRPFCIGRRRGRIVLPARLVDPQRREQLRQVLLHEVGHLQQADILGQLPLALLFPVLFFNPLFWWLRGRMRLASELLADDFAARRSTRTAYARELIALAEEDAGHIPAPLGAACILRSPSEFYRRIKMLLEREDTLSLRCSRWRNVLQTSVAAVLVVGLSSLGGVTAQDRVEDTIRAIRKQLEELQRENLDLRKQLEAAALRGVPLVAYDRDFAVRTVKVREGDDFESFLSKHDVDPADVKRLNPDLDPLRLSVGQGIRIPVKPFAGFAPPRVMDPMGLPPFADPPALPDAIPFAGRAGLPEPSPFADRSPLADANPFSEPSLPGFQRAIPETQTLGELFGAVPVTQPPGGVPQEQPMAGALPITRSRGPIVDAATLQLMNQAIDLEIEIQNGEAELEHLADLAGSNMVTRSSLTQARNSLQGTRRKYELAQRMVQAEIQVTEQELDLLMDRRNQYAKDSQPYREMQSQVQRLSHRLEILGSVR